MYKDTVYITEIKKKADFHIQFKKNILTANTRESFLYQRLNY